jgi:peptidoglycan/LPS O-acetylase OafA/YrhL
MPSAPLTWFLRPATRPFEPELPALTSLRFFAAFMVALCHFQQALPFRVGSHTRILDQSYLAVDFFFVLSGFILAHVYMTSVEQGTFSARDFIVKRLARLYPVHLATLGLSAAMLSAPQWIAGGGRAASDDVGDLAANLLMVHAWGVLDRQTFNAPSWSISSEWFAYLLFPALAAAIVRFRLAPGALLIAAAALFGLVWFAGAPSLAEPAGSWNITWNFGIVRIAPEFLLGVAACRLAGRYDLAPRAAGPALWASILGIVAIGHWELGSVPVVPLFAVVIFAVASRSRNGAAGFLQRPLLVYLGNISYSIYMVHLPCYGMFFSFVLQVAGPQSFAEWQLPIWFASLGFVLMASIVCYNVVETPGRRLIVELCSAHRAAAAPRRIPKIYP